MRDIKVQERGSGKRRGDLMEDGGYKEGRRKEKREGELSSIESVPLTRRSRFMNVSCGR